MPGDHYIGVGLCDILPFIQATLRSSALRNPRPCGKSVFRVGLYCEGLVQPREIVQPVRDRKKRRVPSEMIVAMYGRGPV
jgi:hypothetical protein